MRGLRGRRAGCVEFAFTEPLRPSVGVRGSALFFYQVKNNLLYLVTAPAEGAPLTMYNRQKLLEPVIDFFAD
jgi:hypothetical protein